MIAHRTRMSLGSLMALVALAVAWNPFTDALADIQFAEVELVSGITGEGHGAAWVDFDQDGDLDIFATTWWNGSNLLLRNDGGGVFVDVATTELADAGSQCRGAPWVDYDNDSWPDLYLSRFNLPNVLFSNLEGEVVADTPPELAHTGPAQMVAWGDYDGDGFADIYLTHQSGGNILYRNLGTGGFEVIPGLEQPDYYGAGATWVDYDDDGDADLYVGAGTSADRLYKNLGNGQFTEVTGQAINHGPYTYSSDWGDFDNDGDLDAYIAVADWNHTNSLVRNNGGDSFSEVPGVLSSLQSIYADAKWADVDNDGWLDMFVVDNYNVEVNRLYRNEQGLGFTHIPDLEANLLGAGVNGSASIWGDYNCDGRVDVYLANQGVGNDTGQGQNRLFRNVTDDGNNWLQVELVGAGTAGASNGFSNVSAVGARIRVTKPQGSDAPLQQIRHVSGGSGWLTQNSTIASFGLGQTDSIESIEVWWPRASSMQGTSIYDRDADTILTAADLPDVNVLIRIHEAGDVELVHMRSVRGCVLADATPLEGVVVDLVDSQNEPWFATTDANGEYRFENVILGPADLSVSIPLGYAAFDPYDGMATVEIAECGGAIQDLLLAQIEIIEDARSKGYWKHQANVYLSNKGHAQESEEDMRTTYPTEIFDHFYSNQLASIDVENVTFVGDPAEMIDLLTMRATLSGKGSMENRARAQYMALLLNVASLRLGTQAVVSDDGATVSQVIQHVANLLRDAEPANDEEAKDVCDAINNGQMAPSGLVDLGLPSIPFAPGPRVMSLRSYPNPIKRSATVSYVLTDAGMIRASVYDVAGRLVRNLAAGHQVAGAHQLAWDGLDQSSRRAASGVYFVRIDTHEAVYRHKVTVYR